MPLPRASSVPTASRARHRRGGSSPGRPLHPPSRRAAEHPSPSSPSKRTTTICTSNAAACRAMTPAGTAQDWKMRVTPPSHPSSRADGGRPSAAALPAAVAVPDGRPRTPWPVAKIKIKMMANRATARAAQERLSQTIMQLFSRLLHVSRLAPRGSRLWQTLALLCLWCAGAVAQLACSTSSTP